MDKYIFGKSRGLRPRELPKRLPPVASQAARQHLRFFNCAGYSGCQTKKYAATKLDFLVDII